jgi:hypothetical protein
VWTSAVPVPSKTPPVRLSATEPVKAQGRGNFIDTLAQTDITTIQEIGNKIAAEIFPEVPYTAYGNKHDEPIIKYTPEDNPEQEEPTTNTRKASAIDEEF